MGKVKVAIIGVGNCASSLVQGVEYYKNAESEERISGLMHSNLGGYRIKDIEFTAAFDVDKNKVRKDLSQAIFTKPNCTTKFAKVPKLGVKVQRGMTHDGLGQYLSEIIEKDPSQSADVAGILKDTKTDVLINYLPVGSEMATKWYVEQAIEAGCAFVNCIPVFIASGWIKEEGKWKQTDYWRKRFERAGLPIIGDDIKSQVGATILHRTLVNLFMDRGMPIDRTYQLNTGGNTDFLNMKEEKRLLSKRRSKTNAVTSQIEARGFEIKPDDIYVGPSDYVPWQKDNKLCFLRIESRHFGDVPMNLECRLSVEDSPNSAGVIIDALRCAKLALDRGIGGALLAPSSYLMKTPPEQYPDDICRNKVEQFIKGK
ncbi:inositol-3-phosphate synthase [archaeon]|nr:inositol-3-phosphate synthase [archaeon]